MDYSESRTPGPWRVGLHGSVVADGEVGTHSRSTNTDFYGGPLVCESIRTEANARLIAEAPELLDRLIKLVALAEMRLENTPGIDLYTELALAKGSIARATKPRP